MAWIHGSPTPLPPCYATRMNHRGPASPHYQICAADGGMRSAYRVLHVLSNLAQRGVGSDGDEFPPCQWMRRRRGGGRERGSPDRRVSLQVRPNQAAEGL